MDVDSRVVICGESEWLIEKARFNWNIEKLHFDGLSDQDWKTERWKYWNIEILNYSNIEIFRYRSRQRITKKTGSLKYAIIQISRYFDIGLDVGLPKRTRWLKYSIIQISRYFDIGLDKGSPKRTGWLKYSNIEIFRYRFGFSLRLRYLVGHSLYGHFPFPILDPSNDGSACSVVAVTAVADTSDHRHSDARTLGTQKIGKSIIKKSPDTNAKAFQNYVVYSIS